MTSSTGEALSKTAHNGRIKRRRWPLLLALSALVALTVWHWMWDVTVLSYGSIYFTPKIAAPGQEIQLCLKNVRWSRICHSDLVQIISCNQTDPEDESKISMRRYDLDSHPIVPPPHAQLIPDKCRPFKVPTICKPGPLVFTSYARSECPPFGDWNPRYAYPPDANLTVR